MVFSPWGPFVGSIKIGDGGTVFIFPLNAVTAMQA